mgnify:CR=1 FL=1
MYQIIREEPSALSPEFSSEVNSLIRACLQKDPALRPSIEQLLQSSLLTNVSPLKEPEPSLSNKKSESRQGKRKLFLDIYSDDNSRNLKVEGKGRHRGSLMLNPQKLPSCTDFEFANLLGLNLGKDKRVSNMRKTHFTESYKTKGFELKDCDTFGTDKLSSDAPFRSYHHKDNESVHSSQTCPLIKTDKDSQKSLLSKLKTPAGISGHLLDPKRANLQRQTMMKSFLKEKLGESFERCRDIYLSTNCDLDKLEMQMSDEKKGLAKFFPVAFGLSTPTTQASLDFQHEET